VSRLAEPATERSAAGAVASACWADGSLTTMEEISVSLNSAAFRYSQVVFDACRVVVDGDAASLVAVRRHIARLKRSAAALGLSVQHDDETIVDAARAVVAANAPTETCGLRVFAYQESESFLTAHPASVTVFLLPLGGYAPDRPLRLVCAERVRPAHGGLPRWVKSTAQYALARMEAERAEAAGADDVLFRNELGRVTETSRASLVLVAGDSLVAPPPSEGVLPGVTRDLLARAAASELGWTWSERPIEDADLEQASAAVLCSSSLGVVAVESIEGRRFRDLRAAEELAALYDRMCRGRVASVAPLMLRVPLRGR
jgi:branched-chain amino acid aminotransferase